MNNNITIGICCIGSGVGQSVIHSLRLSNLPSTTIGLGSNPFAYGAYDCDYYDSTPNIYDANYVDVLIEKSIKHRIDILIPGLDDEALIMAKNQSKFDQAGIRTLVSSHKLIELCRNKEKCSIEFNKINPIFVKSFNAVNIYEMLQSKTITFPLFAKPRDGYASKNLHLILNVADLKNIEQDYVIQEIAFPHKQDLMYDFYMRELAKKKMSKSQKFQFNYYLTRIRNLLEKWQQSIS